MAIRRNIYAGSRSVYAAKEGVWAPAGGVDLRAAASIAALILRDLRRGMSYDHYGHVIPFTWDSAAARLRYLYPLSVKHLAGTGREAESEAVRDLVVKVLYSGRIPPEYAHLVTLEGPRAAEVMAELERIGVLPARRRVRTPTRVAYR